MLTFRVAQLHAVTVPLPSDWGTCLRVPGNIHLSSELKFGEVVTLSLHLAFVSFASEVKCNGTYRHSDRPLYFYVWLNINYERWVSMMGECLARLVTMMHLKWEKGKVVRIIVLSVSCPL